MTSAITPVPIKSNYLVTTAIEDTWPINGQPIVFLGEWCRLYSRRFIWGECNGIVANYHWDDRIKLRGDYYFLNEIYEKILSELVGNLNRIHGVNRSERYWRILVGPWLGYFLQALFDRWSMLSSVIESYGVTDCNILNGHLFDILPNDMADFQRGFTEDYWNEAICGEVLENFFSDKLTIHKVEGAPTKILKASIRRGERSNTSKSAVKKIIGWIFSKLPGKKDFFIISSYLAVKFEIAFQFRMGQIPRFFYSAELAHTAPDLSRRAWSLNCCESKLQGSFMQVASYMVPRHIPIAYLEGYDALIKKSKDISWPKSPKLIFTSNSYAADDFFKAWVADKAELGVSFIIGQHGGNFGMSPFAFDEEHQIKIADYWLSWGWVDSNRPNIYPLGNLKAFGRNPTFNPDGGALMVELAFSRYSGHLYATPVARQWLDYFDDQIRFVSALPDNLRRELVIRLYSRDYGWNQRDRWFDKFPDVNVDVGSKNIGSLIGKSRLYISTYNATTYLESLAWNIPTIIFWNPEHWDLKVDVIPFFNLLESVGIFHRTPESAAAQMINVWNDVERWWNSDDVQIARYKFCEQFSKIPNDQLGLMSQLFEGVASEKIIPSDLAFKRNLQ